jgi:AcrR family transcriptional regulator
MCIHNMRASKAKTEVRREQIAQAAMKLLAVRGWRQVSLAAIARAVGVVPSAVYRHYPSKDKVLEAVLELVDQSFAANVHAGREFPGSPVEQLHEVLRRHARVIVGGVPIPRIILSEDVFTGSPRHRKRVHGIYANYLGAIASLLQAGRDQKLIQSNLSNATLALMWLGLVQSPAIVWLLGQGDFDLEQHCERAWSAFAAMLQPTTQRPLD